MSVILNALRSQKDQKGHRRTGGAGLGRNRNSSNAPMVAKVLILVLLVATAFTGVMIWFKNYMTRRTTAENSALIAKAPPLVPPKPAEVETQVSKARALFYQERIPEALELYEKELAKNPNSAFLHNDIGLLLVKLENYSAAERHFNRAIQIDSGCVECFNNMGYLKTLEGQTEEAQKYLKKALAIKSTFPDAYFNLGVLYEKNGDYGNAINSYKEFLSRVNDEKLPYFSETQERIKILSER